MKRPNRHPPSTIQASAADALSGAGPYSIVSNNSATFIHSTNPSRRVLGYYWSCNLPIDIRQTEVAARVTVGQPLVVDSQQVEDSCMEIVHVRGVFDHVQAEIIRRPVSHPALYAPSGKQ